MNAAHTSIRTRVDLAAQSVLTRLRDSSTFVWLSLLTWGLGIALGWFGMTSYSQRPGELLEPPSQWPTDTRLAGSSQRARLLLFAHPHCPCTRATLSELSRLLAGNPDQLECQVVFTRPAGTSTGWETSDLLRTAAAIPGVSTIVDQDGVEAQRFRARTSGVAMLYDSQGQLVFHGGLTAFRGHEGDSLGLAAIRDYLQGETPCTTESNVFGCPLESPEIVCQCPWDARSIASCKQGHECCQMK